MDALFSAAVEGFVLECKARSLSPHTILDYTRTFKKFSKFLSPEDPQIRQINSHMIAAFLGLQEVSKKSKLNYYIGLSLSLDLGAAGGAGDKHEVREFRPPRPETRQIEPFSEDNIKSLLREISYPRAYNVRMRAVILILLDTGIRVSELCSLTIRDLHLKDGYLVVYGKGDKERRVEFGPRTGQAIWKYLSTRGKPDPN